MKARTFAITGAFNALTRSAVHKSAGAAIAPRKKKHRYNISKQTHFLPTAASPAERRGLRHYSCFRFTPFPKRTDRQHNPRLRGRKTIREAIPGEAGAKPPVRRISACRCWKPGIILLVFLVLFRCGVGCWTDCKMHHAAVAAQCFCKQREAASLDNGVKPREPVQGNWRAVAL